MSGSYHQTRLGSIDEVDDLLREVSRPSVRTLYSIWEQRQPIAVDTGKHSTLLNPGDTINHVGWIQSDIQLLTRFLEHALNKEEFLLVCDAYKEGIAYWQMQLNVDQGILLNLHCYFAAAKVRLGSTSEASHLLQPLAICQKLTTEQRARVYLQLGDIKREESHHSPAPADRLIKGREALSFYKLAYDMNPKQLEGQLLHATMMLIVSDEGTAERAEARELGTAVYNEILRLEHHQAITDKEMVRLTWFKAVALSVRGDLDGAAAFYDKLQRIPGISTNQLTEARYRSQFLAEAWGLPRNSFYGSFPPLELIVFSGHLPDIPNSKGPSRFPLSAVPEVRKRLEEKLDHMRARVGLLSAAPGGDLLFIEALRKRGALYHVSLPWSVDEFVRTSVEPYDVGLPEPFWKPLFDKALAGAETVREVGQFYQPGDDVGWEYCREVTAGLALLTARVSRLDIKPFALWDERSGTGTESFVEFWSHYLGHPPVVVKLDAPSYLPINPIGRRSERDSLHQEVKSMLFADIVGYSKLTEKVIRDFVEVFMHRLSELMSKSAHAPRSVNTWGDAVFAVFDFAEDAGRFSLQLIQMVKEGESEWLRRGLCYEERDLHGNVIQRPLNIRVGLHTGPVFAHYNPILRQLGFTGQHVSRAARIEPVAAPGEVYASEEFAAMTEIGNEIRKKQNTYQRLEGNGFVCEFAGSMRLAKNYPGRFRIYRLAPFRELGLEELAQAAHSMYVENQIALGNKPEDVPALRPWEDLREDLRNANRAQVGDIPNKLYLLGYELTAGYGMDPTELKLSPQVLENLSIREHDRWMRERASQGWVYGPKRDNARRYHPDMIPWDEMSEPKKQLDRDVVNNLPALIQRAGFRLRKIAPVLKSGPTGTAPIVDLGYRPNPTC